MVLCTSLCRTSWSKSIVSSIFVPSAMISEHNHRLKSRKPSLLSSPVILNENPSVPTATMSMLESWRDAVFFSINLIYISQSPFIKSRFKRCHTSRPYHRDLQASILFCMWSVFVHRACFGPCWNGIILMGWSLVCVLTVSEKYLLWEVLRSHDPLHS